MQNITEKYFCSQFALWSPPPFNPIEQIMENLFLDSRQLHEQVVSSARKYLDGFVLYWAVAVEKVGSYRVAEDVLLSM